jgi:hypothetical protein
MLTNHKQQIKLLDYRITTHIYVLKTCARHMHEHIIIQLKKMKIYTSKNDTPCVERHLGRKKIIP